MSRKPRLVISEQTASEHVARYEALRRHVTQRQGGVACHGLAVLLCQGVAAWMEVASKVLAPPVHPAQEDKGRPEPLPGGSSAEVVRVLAAMTLEHIQPVQL